jgi:predicted ATPase
MRIEQITLKNFRIFKEVTIENLPGFAVFVGVNGSGKSTLFDVFGFLRDCLKNNVRQALQVRGGFREVVSRESEAEDIVLELKFRMEITSVERLVTYHLEIGWDGQKPFVKREILRYKRGRHGSPYHFLDFKNGEGYAVTNEEDFSKQDEELDREVQKLDSPDILAIKGVGQFQRFKAASAFRQLIEEWHVSDFHISKARGKKDSGYAEHLSVSGDNLALVAQYIYENHGDIFHNILESMQRRVPGISTVEAHPLDDGSLVLRFKDGSFQDPFIDRFVSDGTIKMFAYLILLHDPSPHPLLCVEEPENQLYPDLLPELAEEFRSYAEGRNGSGQVFVSTHSPDFLNAVELDEVYCLVKRADGYTEVKPAGLDENIRSLMAAGDKMGWLWKQGLFAGVGLR